MKKQFSFFALFCLLAMAMLTACSEKFPGYKKTANGIYYKFYHHDAAAPKPNASDFVKVEMACYLHDTLYYDWQNLGSEVYTQLKESKFAGDLLEAYGLMHVGDSASFYIKADSTAVLYYDQDPAAVGIQDDDYFRFEVKLVDAITLEQFQANVERMKDQMEQASKQRFADYIERECIDVTPTNSGVYVVPIGKGKGRCPMEGEKVQLDFEAFLLEGPSVGSTYGSDEKFEFVLGEGNAIPFWEEIVPLMHLGERVRAIIPFDMAYGEHQVGDIPAYSNLIYDIELLKITTKEELAKQNEAQMKALKAQSEQAFWDYLKANDITEHTPNGLYIKKLLTTDGATPEQGQKVRIKYVVTYLDGTELGTSDMLGEFYEMEYGAGKVLKGLEEGVGQMRVGEKARLVVPYPMAYGRYPYKNIPAYSNLVFDVELIEIK